MPSLNTTNNKFQNDVTNAIATQLAVTPQDIDPNSTLREDLGLGPIEMTDLLAALSRQFEVSIPAEEAARLIRVSDIIALLEDLSLE